MAVAVAAQHRFKLTRLRRCCWGRNAHKRVGYCRFYAAPAAQLKLGRWAAEVEKRNARNGKKRALGRLKETPSARNVPLRGR